MAIPAPDNHSVWDEVAADALRGEYGTTYEGLRSSTVVVAQPHSGEHECERRVVYPRDGNERHVRIV
jgi:hypothetical protein